MERARRSAFIRWDLVGLLDPACLAAGPAESGTDRRHPARWEVVIDEQLQNEPEKAVSRPLGQDWLAADTDGDSGGGGSDAWPAI